METTVFPSDVLIDAMRILDPDTFKLFVYIYDGAQKSDPLRETDNCACERLSEYLSISNNNVIQSFLKLRRLEWLDIFVAYHDVFDKIEQSVFNVTRGIRCKWRLFLQENEHCWQHVDVRKVTEQEEPDNLPRQYIAIGPRHLAQYNGKSKLYNTPHWKFIRERTLERDGYKCIMCNSFENLVVHHLTYINQGEELLSELKTLCRSCHGKIPKSLTENTMGF